MGRAMTLGQRTHGSSGSHGIFWDFLQSLSLHMVDFMFLYDSTLTQLSRESGKLLLQGTGQDPGRELTSHCSSITAKKTTKAKKIYRMVVKGGYQLCLTLRPQDCSTQASSYTVSRGACSWSR